MRYTAAMGLGRRGTPIEDDSAWVFNRMADVYDARPAYPAALVDALTELARSCGCHVLDLGAGIGHLALPLAQRGLTVTGIEPARWMLQRLAQSARDQGLDVRCLHAAAEALPIDDASVDCALIADALHFLDAEQTGHELARVLGPRAGLAIVTSELGDTPFMRALVHEMESAAPRRPRETGRTQAQLAALSGVRLMPARSFQDETPLDHAQLERVLRSISFIGPAMNPERFARFIERVRAIPHPTIWTRTFTLRAGRRAR